MRAHLPVAFIVRASRRDNGTVNGQFVVHGEAVESFYCKSGPVANSLMEIAGGGPMAPVACDVRVFAGTDYDTKKPNGRLSIEVRQVWALSAEEASAAVGTVVPVPAGS